MAYAYSYTFIYKATLLSALVLSALNGTASAQVATDGSVGDAINIEANGDKVYEITDNLGTTAGNNLFHSFHQFTVETDYTARFSGPANIRNIISRVTGPDISNIDGTISSTIQGANLYLLNPNGILFGANAKLDISGSFHASTANYLKFGDNEFFYAALTEQSSFVAAAPSAFGFTTNKPNPITVSANDLALQNGNTLSLIGGDVNFDGAKVTVPNGTLQLASTASRAEVSTDLSGMDQKAFDKKGGITLNNDTQLDVSGDSGGKVVIRGGHLTMDNSTISASVSGATNGVTGPGIDVGLSGDLGLDNNSHLLTNVRTGSFANSSGIKISAYNGTVANKSSVESATQQNSLGKSGNVTIDIKDKLQLGEQSKISTQTSGFGDSGDISIRAKSLELEPSSVISTSAVYTLFPAIVANRSNAGNINIQANKITFTGFLDPQSPAFDVYKEFTGIYANGGILGGTSGNITIETKDLRMTNDTAIISNMFGAGKGGDITISAQHGRVALLDGAGISTSTNLRSDGEAPGGNIVIAADDVLISGIDMKNGKKSTVKTIANNHGTAGDITISGKSIQVDNGASIESHSIYDAAFNASPGNITLTGEKITINGVNNAYMQQLLSKGQSQSDALTESRTTVTLENVSPVDGKDDYAPGNITIHTNYFSLTDNAQILLENSSRERAGNININSRKITVFKNSELLTHSLYGQGKGGDINISTKIAVFDKSTIKTTAISGRGGDINVNAKTIITTPDAIFDASSKFFIDGKISFNTMEEITKSTTVLPSTIADPTRFLSDSCTNQAGRYSSFIVAKTFSYAGISSTYLSSHYTNGSLDSNSVVRPEVFQSYDFRPSYPAQEPYVMRLGGSASFECFNI